MKTTAPKDLKKLEAQTVAMRKQMRPRTRRICCRALIKQFPDDPQAQQILSVVFGSPDHELLTAKEASHELRFFGIGKSPMALRRLRKKIVKHTESNVPVYLNRLGETASSPEGIHLPLVEMEICVGAKPRFRIRGL